MHVECARWANFYLDIDREISNHDDLDKDDNFEWKQKWLEYRTNFERKVFCEPHRPFKLIQEINEKRNIQLQEIIEFYKVLQKCLVTMKR